VHINNTLKTHTGRGCQDKASQILRPRQ